MLEDRVDDADAAEDGRGGREEYEINSMGKPVRNMLMSSWWRSMIKWKTNKLLLWRRTLK